MDYSNYEFFWDGECSQWHPRGFTIEGIRFNCAEQWMMYNKAKLFGDDTAVNVIMQSDSPRVQKAWGRKVRNFDGSKWNEISRLVVYRGNLAKFTQNEDMYDYLLGTGDKIIVEASPEDVIWGIGLHESEARRTYPTKWPGKNWLGLACMQVREDLKAMTQHMWRD